MFFGTRLLSNKKLSEDQNIPLQILETKLTKGDLTKGEDQFNSSKNII